MLQIFNRYLEYGGEEEVVKNIESDTAAKYGSDDLYGGLCRDIKKARREVHDAFSDAEK